MCVCGVVSFFFFYRSLVLLRVPPAVPLISARTFSKSDAISSFVNVALMPRTEHTRSAAEEQKGRRRVRSEKSSVHSLFSRDCDFAILCDEPWCRFFGRSSLLLSLARLRVCTSLALVAAGRRNEKHRETKRLSDGLAAGLEAAHICAHRRRARVL